MKNRVSALGALKTAIAVLLIVPAFAAVSQTPTSEPIKNIVLVHGAWADGSSWAKIIPLLQAKGFHVVCAQIPLTSIADDVTATNRIIDAQDGPVLLAGHSYGGAVITEAGNNPKVAGLVYVAAFAPDEGETLAALAKPFGATPAFGEIKPIADGFLLLTSKGVAEDFAQDLSAEEQKTMVATQGATREQFWGRQSPPQPGTQSQVGLSLLRMTERFRPSKRR
jgi:pimeloyl-ACP methyl ester carboxylesterase